MRIDLQCPFHDKDLAKQRGAHANVRGPFFNRDFEVCDKN